MTRFLVNRVTWWRVHRWRNQCTYQYITPLKITRERRKNDEWYRERKNKEKYKERKGDYVGFKKMYTCI